jgi:hypothetical protein
VETQSVYFRTEVTKILTRFAREARYWIVGTLVLLLFLTPVWELVRPAVQVISLRIVGLLIVGLLIAAVVFLGRWALSRLPRERR